MRGKGSPCSIYGILACLIVVLAKADNPYRFLTWTVTYGTISPLGVPQQGILINGQFPGPQLDVITNDNLDINVINKLDEPFLLTWNGIQQRKNSWMDGVLGTNCPIPPNGNFTYRFQPKDQIGTYFYFPTTLMHRAAGGFGGMTVFKRVVIPAPYPPLAGDHQALIGDWYKTNHKDLQKMLDMGRPLAFPDGILINGHANGAYFYADPGKTCFIRISNVGLQTTLNFRIQGHKLKLVEVEGSHTIQNVYDSIDVHVGQSYGVLVVADQPPKDYYVVASTRFTDRVLTSTAIFHYRNTNIPLSLPLPPAPTDVEWSINQARSIRWNLTTNAARPNPQGSFHYGLIKPMRRFVLANSAPLINGKLRYAVNEVSYISPETPLKLADWFNIAGVFDFNTFPSVPSGGFARLGTSVVASSLHDYVEIIFQNNENTIQTWHIDGFSFWVVGMGIGQWKSDSWRTYNLVDAVSRHTTQVYPNSWTAIYLSMDNQGMWNARSAMWARQYLGQQLYFRVFSSERSLAREYSIPHNTLLCGRARGMLIS
ncbi:L-ascorbate oxidase homolog isoform X1 [Amborella trichopoda]|uniref:L-ascorbate oxidase n=2 Tax=Amborella trichopoda TaxID=13333 RepID=W1PJH2_AMBTC|nr:L-ascorbate oxidase homolog isoform X1 [Amborella trichopoda]XP_020525592.1 L-ascorbate oxidase homolog isoform X1 [Amborella trichopoda]XP_020525593.1 L-ascorbate oxidase homolog isoform X1 [Amborella trichopoda]ERN10137.1 hypothetical protein AMTR_s00169p00049950 [Amborella trichopoda]|eukprot:XP_006848556.1 L-ascorbate oxidase homolog isoform X1 [Amborella trichopoda]